MNTLTIGLIMIGIPSLIILLILFKDLFVLFYNDIKQKNIKEKDIRITIATFLIFSFIVGAILIIYGLILKETI